MMNKPGIWVAASLDALMLLLLGIVLSSCATIATEQQSLQTETTQAGALGAQPEETLAPYPLASPGTDYPPPVVYATYNPYPLEQLDPTEKALIAQKETNVAAIVMTMTAEPTKPTGTPEPTLSPEQIAANLEEMKRMMKSEGAIMLEDNGQTFTYTLATRFFVYLDDQKYPVGSLECKPNWVMGYISNGDFNGPDLYPKYYEAEELGSCILTNHDFAAKIVVVDWPTPTPGGP